MPFGNTKQITSEQLPTYFFSQYPFVFCNIFLGLLWSNPVLLYIKVRAWLLCLVHTEVDLCCLCTQRKPRSVRWQAVTHMNAVVGAYILVKNKHGELCRWLYVFYKFLQFCIRFGLPTGMAVNSTVFWVATVSTFVDNYLRYFRLPPRCKWDFRCSGILRSVDW